MITFRRIKMKDINEQAQIIIQNSSYDFNHEKDPFVVLIKTIISQRNRDEVTEKVSNIFFLKFKNVAEVSRADISEVESVLKASGMYRQKSIRIIQISKILIEKYDGKVPDSLEKLLELPGVGRKTANIVLYNSFNIPALAVDTHVHRISNRLGWVSTKTPEKTEEALSKLLKKEFWGPVNEAMVYFGKTICRPISPKCVSCYLNQSCPSAKLP
jgi:endonuclease-3